MAHSQGSCHSSADLMRASRLKLYRSFEGMLDILSCRLKNSASFTLKTSRLLTDTSKRGNPPIQDKSSWIVDPIQ